MGMAAAPKEVRGKSCLRQQETAIADGTGNAGVARKTGATWLAAPRGRAVGAGEPVGACLAARGDGGGGGWVERRAAGRARV